MPTLRVFAGCAKVKVLRRHPEERARKLKPDIAVKTNIGERFCRTGSAATAWMARGRVAAEPLLKDLATEFCL